MLTSEAARDLATTLVTTCKRFNVKAKAIITDMEQPLGTAIGNAAEVREALLTFHGSGPADLVHLTTTFAFELLKLAGKEIPFNDVTANLTNGHAQNHFEAMIEKQGGRLCQLPAIHWTPLIATQEGYLEKCRHRRPRLLISANGWRPAASRRDHRSHSRDRRSQKNW